VSINRTFLNAAFRDMPSDAAATLAAFGGDPNNKPSEGPDYRWTANPWRLDEPLPAKFLSGFGRRNQYFAISSFRRAEDGKFRRRKDCFAQMHLVMIDDIGPKVSAKKLRLRLSARIETSPGNHQGFLFIEPSDACRDRETCERLIDGMIRAGLTADGKDPGMRGVTRYGRLPDGVNGKAKYVAQLGKPWDCKLDLWKPERRYAVEEIAHAFKLDLTARTSRLPRDASKPYARPLASLPLPKGEATRRVAEFERLLHTLADAGLYLSTRGSWHDVVCPWIAEHTDQKPGGSALYDPAEGNDWLGGFKCWHGHCEHRTVGDVYRYGFLLRRGAA
jgi:hypothetical protein